MAFMELVIMLLVAGALLLLLETVLPGMIAGIIGLLCLITAVVVGYDRLGVPAGHWVLLGVLFGLILGTIIWLKYFPTSRLARPFVSKSTVGDIGTDRPELLNQTGTAFTHLRPSGTALINGKRVDVVTEGAMIERGKPIKVVANEGMRVIVREI